jgi:outer membrane lipoprotein SlyB
VRGFFVVTFIYDAAVVATAGFPLNRLIHSPKRTDLRTRIAFAAIVAACAFSAAAQSPNASPTAHAAVAAAHCQDCATVQEVHSVKRKGEGGAAGMIGGAVVGGLLGHQVGGGTGKTLATVGGAAAGAYAGNEVQKSVNSKIVWVTKVKMKDGSVKTFEQAKQPTWKSGQLVHVKDGALSSL